MIVVNAYQHSINTCIILLTFNGQGFSEVDKCTHMHRHFQQLHRSTVYQFVYLDVQVVSHGYKIPYCFIVTRLEQFVTGMQTLLPRFVAVGISCYWEYSIEVTHDIITVKYSII